MSADDRYRGMTPRDEWAKTAIGASSKYACARCGTEFASPHDVYDHLDEVHPDNRTNPISNKWETRR